MPDMAVTPESLRAAAGAAAALGGELRGLAGQFTGGPDAGSDPGGETAGAMGRFATRWGRGVGDSGDSIADLGGAADAAAALYEHTDRTLMGGNPA